LEGSLVIKLEKKDETGAPEMRVGRLPAAKSKGMTNMMARKECESRNPDVLGRKEFMRRATEVLISPSSQG
jgi:hypothetical protein